MAHGAPPGPEPASMPTNPLWPTLAVLALLACAATIVAVLRLVAINSTSQATAAMAVSAASASSPAGSSSSSTARATSLRNSEASMAAHGNNHDDAPPPRRLTVAFVHPDLGIGGAERLIVDAAAGLQSRGHTVRVYTSHHNPRHSFPETNDGTLNVSVHGDWLPRSIAGGMHVLCAWLRNLWLCMYLVAMHAVRPSARPDVYFVDQISVGVPLLKWTGARVLFYCHFPDKLLATRKSKLKALYRVPFDWIEEKTTSMADEIVVNSKFTRAVFHQSFPSIRHVPAVVYPGVPEPAAAASPTSSKGPTSAGMPLIFPPNTRILLSINRFERKKNVKLALDAFARVAPQNAVLVLAGGFDPRVPENKATLESLIRHADALHLEHETHALATRRATVSPPSISPSTRIVFLPSVPEPAKQSLLAHAAALLYTPAYEHFGIVPVEAMYSGVPVVALGNGGPAESVAHRVTGYLCATSAQQRASTLDLDAVDLDHMVRTVHGAGDGEGEELISAFAQGIKWVLGLAPDQRRAVARAARARAHDCFSMEAFLDGVDSALMACMAGARVAEREVGSAGGSSGKGSKMD
ncbi:Alpha-1,3-mannosyltransferase-like protein [Allomyces arbusculus]|nr:Alpha-1,3-mannosyltransferase-like protein [Allomyces arbusculus]